MTYCVQHINGDWLIRLGHIWSWGSYKERYEFATSEEAQQQILLQRIQALAVVKIEQKTEFYNELSEEQP